MKRTVRIKISDSVIGYGGFLYAANDDGEVYISLRHIEQFSFTKNSFRYVLASNDIDGYAEISFTQDGMGEYHRIKREVEEYMGISSPSVEPDSPVTVHIANSEMNMDMA